MDTPTPLRSGFGHDSTADDVLAGSDLGGRFAVVTGGYSGLGLEMTRSLARAGAEVLVPARRPDRAGEVLADVPRASVAALDLSDQADVRRLAGDVRAAGRPVDLVVNAAGIMRGPRTTVGPGWEAHLAVHHLGHFTLTVLLAPVLAEGARVVGLSSAGHFLSDMRWEDPHFARPGAYDRWTAYGQSKTAVSLAALHLDGLLAPRGAHAFSVHPGSILTPLQREVPLRTRRELGWVVGEDDRPAPGFKTPEQGAATAVWAATSPLLEGHGGAYCQDCDIAAPADSDDMLAGGVKPWVLDRGAAERLWWWSAGATGVGAVL
ncbi:oxidoreductase [Nocardiopsis sp. CC223A]|uniref:oxidoreductase n=1 Tax=Nocardiopsis sp. CC223A TaxID=3044051 RepID=UPI00278BB4CF|nr:oxidoreductase [Nocardiopsis sp. CC223A]